MKEQVPSSVGRRPLSHTAPPSVPHPLRQTPAVPSPSNPNPDGACVGHCYCGDATPCGEYLWK